jgi:hypothetical protein
MSSFDKNFSYICVAFHDWAYPCKDVNLTLLYSIFWSGVYQTDFSSTGAFSQLLQGCLPQKWVLVKYFLAILALFPFHLVLSLEQ